MTAPNFTESIRSILTILFYAALFIIAAAFQSLAQTAPSQIEPAKTSPIIAVDEKQKAESNEECRQQIKNCKTQIPEIDAAKITGKENREFELPDGGNKPAARLSELGEGDALLQNEFVSDDQKTNFDAFADVEKEAKILEAKKIALRRRAERRSAELAVEQQRHLAASENKTLMPRCALDVVMRGSDSDPFDERAGECWQLYQKLNPGPADPFRKVVWVEADSVQSQFGAIAPAQLWTTEATPVDGNYAATLRRATRGFDPRWTEWIAFYAAAEGVDPLLVLEVMRWESSFNPVARSWVGALGLMQFMPGTAARFNINPLDEEQAIKGGAKYLGFLLRRFNGNVLSALAGYNAGEGAVDAFGSCRPVRAGQKIINPRGICTPNGIPPYEETKRYAKGIWANYQTSVRHASGIVNPQQRIIVNVRFKMLESSSAAVARLLPSDDDRR